MKILSRQQRVAWFGAVEHFDGKDMRCRRGQKHAFATDSLAQQGATLWIWSD